MKTKNRFKGVLEGILLYPVVFVLGIVVFGLILSVPICLIHPSRIMNLWLVRQYGLPAALTALATINLIIYQLTGTIVHYIWQKKGISNSIKHAGPDERMLLKRQYGVKTDRALRKVKVRPSVLTSMLFANRGSSIVRQYLIDGPHIADKQVGIITSRGFFEFAVRASEDMNRDFFSKVFHPRFRRYLFIWVAFVNMSFIFWGLIPYAFSLLTHFAMANEFVANLTGEETIKEGADAKFIQRLHDEIWRQRHERGG